MPRPLKETGILSQGCQSSRLSPLPEEQEGGVANLLQPLGRLRTRQVGLGIHRAKDVVAGHLRVERADQAAEPLLADQSIHLTVIHLSII